ncbi:MAG: hypothetical protein ACFE9Q_11555 [Candidatus Hodarchaeota archaeon]
MGLDKWLKSDEIKKKSRKKKSVSDQAEQIKSENKGDKANGKHPIKLSKYTLICPNAKCKYQKTIMKRQLTGDDKTCPRCNKEMKVMVK